MPQFTYTAINNAGETRSGNLFASSEDEALNALARLDLKPLSLAEGGRAGPWWSREISFFGTQNRLKIADQINFFATLATMLSADFSLSKALDFTRDQSRGPLKLVANTISDRVLAGGTLTEALSETDRFDDWIISILSVGERSNKLSVVVSEIADLLIAEQSIKSKIQQALIYPIILMIVSFGIFLLLVFFLAPTLVPVFLGANVEPPLVLMFLDGLRVVLTEHPLGAAIVLLVGNGAFFSLWRRGKKFVARLPGFRVPAIKRRSVTLMDTVRLMLRAGEQVSVAIHIAETSTPEPLWKRQLGEVRQKVESGSTIHAALSDATLFDQEFLAFVELGEEANRLPDMLGHACALGKEQIATYIDRLLRLLTPALTLAIGVAVALLIFATISAIMDLNDLAL